MKIRFLLFVTLSFILLSSCGGTEKPVNEGIVTFEIEYPDSKENFFLYHILPKELNVSFKNNKLELKIKKASLENTIVVDGNKRNMTAYYNYGEVFTSNLTSQDISKLIASQPKYNVKLTSEKDTLIGFNIKKAIAIDPEFPKREIEIWYTNEIKLKNPNWFNGFEKIPGFMLKYSVVQYNMKMEFVAKKFDPVTISDSVVNPSRPGKIISHTEFDKKISDLFESFN